MSDDFQIVEEALRIGEASYLKESGLAVSFAPFNLGHEALARLRERMEKQPEWVTCDYQPEKREDDPGGRSCTEALNWYATEVARLREREAQALDKLSDAEATIAGLEEALRTISQGRNQLQRERALRALAAYDTKEEK